MRKKKGETSKGFDNLLGAYTNALSQNSKSIEDMLKALSSKKLTDINKKELRKLKRELDRIDDTLDNLDGLGDYYGI